MGNLTGIFIVGFITLGIYKTFELFVKRKERLTFIEKFFTHCEQKEVPTSFQMPPISFNNQNYSTWALKIALLLIGVGIGALLNVFTVVWANAEGLNISYEIHGFISFAYFAFFGGLGLLISYLIESKQSKKE
ncbi:MAG: hypothetical protein LBD76_03265 [Prevotellaceae bacterium]|jgi:hypothetical protein|nr:hypothetical protein [Prevotellaceae bacterium]